MYKRHEREKYKMAAAMWFILFTFSVSQAKFFLARFMSKRKLRKINAFRGNLWCRCLLVGFSSSSSDTLKDANENRCTYLCSSRGFRGTLKENRKFDSQRFHSIWLICKTHTSTPAAQKKNIFDVYWNEQVFMSLLSFISRIHWKT